MPKGAPKHREVPKGRQRCTLPILLSTFRKAYRCPFTSWLLQRPPNTFLRYTGRLRLSTRPNVFRCSEGHAFPRPAAEPTRPSKRRSSRANIQRYILATISICTLPSCPTRYSRCRRTSSTKADVLRAGAGQTRQRKILLLWIPRRRNRRANQLTTNCRK